MDPDTLTTVGTWNNTTERVGPNGVSVTVAAGRLWLVNAAYVPATTIACADATTGVVLATEHFAHPTAGAPSARWIINLFSAPQPDSQWLTFPGHVVRRARSDPNRDAS